MATPYTDISKNLDSRYQDIELKYEIEAINNSISNILTISKGEIPGRPDFGSNVPDFIFELNDEVTWVAVKEVVKNAILEFEPRINVTDIQVTGFVDQNVVMITITYYVIRSGAQGVYSKTFEV